MGGGYGGERPTLGDHALGATHRMLVELGGPEVPMDGALGREARGLPRGGPFAFGGAGGMRGHAFSSDRRVQARERRPCSCASTAAITAMFTISFTSEPRCSTCTGCAIPTRMGMAQPVHVLQRGSDVNDIVNMAVIAAVDAQEHGRRSRA